MKENSSKQQPVVKMLRHSDKKTGLSCFIGWQVTHLWNIALTTFLPSIQSCSSKFLAWSSIAGSFCKGRRDHKLKIVDRPFKPIKVRQVSVSRISCNWLNSEASQIRAKRDSTSLHTVWLGVASHTVSTKWTQQDNDLPPTDHNTYKWTELNNLLYSTVRTVHWKTVSCTWPNCPEQKLDLLLKNTCKFPRRRICNLNNTVFYLHLNQNQK